MKRGPAELQRVDEQEKRLDLKTLDEAPANPFSPQLKDPLLYMGSWLNNADLFSFSLSCRQAALWTKEHRDFRAAPRLLELVVQGNQDAAKVMLQSNPALILCNKGRAIDYSGKRIQGLTAFQAALCAGDVEMCLMMKDVCATIENGQEALQEQYKAMFPDGGIEAYSQEQANQTFDFSDIIKAILNAPEDQIQGALNKEFDDSKPLHKALSTFRAAFDKLSFDTQIFNPWHLHQAFTLYDECFDAAQSWNKRDLIWRQVVGYTQRHLPACYAQSFAQGIYNLVEGKEHLRRVFDFRYGGGAIFPLGAGGDLGFDFGCEGRAWAGTPRSPVLARWLEKLFRAKTSILERAFQPAEKPQLLVCSVLK